MKHSPNGQPQPDSLPGWVWALIVVGVVFLATAFASGARPFFGFG